LKSNGVARINAPTTEGHSTRAIDRRWGTRFGSWLRDYGVPRLCTDLSITKNSVYDWVRGSTSPDPRNAIRITQLSKGRVSLEDVYRHRAELSKPEP